MAPSGCPCRGFEAVKSFVKFDPARERSRARSLFGWNARLEKSGDATRLARYPPAARDLRELVVLAEVYSDIATPHKCGHCCRGVNRDVRFGTPLWWASGTSCLCISACWLRGIHRHWGAVVFAYLDVAGAATGTPGAVFELECADHRDAIPAKQPCGSRTRTLPILCLLPSPRGSVD